MIPSPATKMKPKNNPEPSNVDPAPIPVRRVPVLTQEEAGEYLAALAHDPTLLPILRRGRSNIIPTL